MDCSIVQHNLFSYLEDTLPPDVKRNIDFHLSGCKSCKQLLTDSQSVEAVIKKTKLVDLNPFITTRIIQHIENELTSQGKNRVFVIRPILVTLTILGAIVLGYTIGKSGSERINGYAINQNQIENLKTELFIHDFIDEDNTILINE